MTTFNEVKPIIDKIIKYKRETATRLLPSDNWFDKDINTETEITDEAFSAMMYLVKPRSSRRSQPPTFKPLHYLEAGETGKLYAYLLEYLHKADNEAINNSQAIEQNRRREHQAQWNDRINATIEIGKLNTPPSMDRITEDHILLLRWFEDGQTHGFYFDAGYETEAQFFDNIKAGATLSIKYKAIRGKRYMQGTPMPDIPNHYEKFVVIEGPYTHTATKQIIGIKTK